MALAIIHVILIFCMLAMQPLAHAQDMLSMPAAAAAITAVTPVTLKFTGNEEFSFITWRGITGDYHGLINEDTQGCNNGLIDRAMFNRFCALTVRDNNEIVRNAWKEAFGFDVWYPYYQAKKWNAG